MEAPRRPEKSCYCLLVLVIACVGVVFGMCGDAWVLTITITKRKLPETKTPAAACVQALKAFLT